MERSLMDCATNFDASVSSIAKSVATKWPGFAITKFKAVLFFGCISPRSPGCNNDCFLSSLSNFHNPDPDVNAFVSSVRSRTLPQYSDVVLIVVVAHSPATSQEILGATSTILCYSTIPSLLPAAGRDTTISGRDYAHHE